MKTLGVDKTLGRVKDSILILGRKDEATFVETAPLFIYISVSLNSEKFRQDST